MSEKNQKNVIYDADFRPISPDEYTRHIEQLREEARRKAEAERQQKEAGRC